MCVECRRCIFRWAVPATSHFSGTSVPGHRTQLALRCRGVARCLISRLWCESLKTSKPIIHAVRSRDVGARKSEDLKADIIIFIIAYEPRHPFCDTFSSPFAAKGSTPLAAEKALLAAKSSTPLAAEPYASPAFVKTAGATHPVASLRANSPGQNTDFSRVSC